MFDVKKSPSLFFFRNLFKKDLTSEKRTIGPGK
jgi:hypothetical protein